jgi:site-specific DNA-cytosine methylase
MTLLPEKILSGEVEAPDLFCGGTPCQAFSVAGLRNSLDDARGNLSLTFVGIANAIDHVRSLRGESKGIIFWENVPGVLNTKDNAFGCFLGALAGEDDPLMPSGEKWTNAGCVYGPQRTVAWRVLDAQYFGVAQRRRRVFVVASARKDFDPAKVLFEFEGLRRDIAPSRKKGERIAPCVTNGPPFSRTGNERVEAEAMVVQPIGFDSYNLCETGDVTQTIKSPSGGFTESIGAVYIGMAVRRLTPTECERLQGFPDGYTNIPWRKAAESPDGPRYKALGNSWAVPVVRWIGQRIQKSETSALAKWKRCNAGVE